MFGVNDKDHLYWPRHGRRRVVEGSEQDRGDRARPDQGDHAGCFRLSPPLLPSRLPGLRVESLGGELQRLRLEAEALSILQVPHRNVDLQTDQAACQRIETARAMGETGMRTLSFRTPLTLSTFDCSFASLPLCRPSSPSSPVGARPGGVSGEESSA